VFRLFHYRDFFLKYKITLTGIFFLVFTLNYIIIKVGIYQPSLNGISYNNNNFNVLGLNIPQNLDFCGEKIPSNDFRIKHALEKEFFTSSYWKTNSVIIFNKAQRWFPYIEPILKREGVPDDFKYLAVIESHLENVMSPVGAAGFWQLVPVSARQYGLEVNDYIDERYHVEKATYAACQHIKEAHEIFKNWTLAAAAYNRGIGGIISALRKQKGRNYYDLLLNPETGAFVYRILAYKTLLSNPEHYGLRRKKLQYAAKIPYKVYRVDSSVSSLKSLAEYMGCNVVTIRIFNPWILKNRLDNPAGKVYEIRVPVKKDMDYSAYARDLLPEGDGLRLYVKDTTIVQSVAADTLLMRSFTYVVKVDEPLLNLAEFFKVNLNDLKKWNNLENTETAVKGQTLVIQVPKK
jgi:membrane-bound lytic murein transglycosylase D